jgi:hypothetical protein
MSAERIACRLAAELQVLCPETRREVETFAATVVEIGPAGLRLRCGDRSGDLFRLLLRELRHARLELREAHLEFLGRVMWIGCVGGDETEVAFALEPHQAHLARWREELIRLARPKSENPALSSVSPASAPLAQASPQEAQIERISSRRSLWESALAAADALTSFESEVPAAALCLASGKNRRRFPRVPSHFACEFQFRRGLSENEPQVFEAFVIDISWNGARIQFPEESRQDILNALHELSSGSAPFARARGWLTLASPCQRISVSAKVAHVGFATEREVRGVVERVIELGLAIDGSERATKYARLALAEALVSSSAEYQKVVAADSGEIPAIIHA